MNNKKILAMLSLVAFTVCFIATPVNAKRAIGRCSPRPNDQVGKSDTLIQYINQYRNSKGVQSLRKSQQLITSAAHKANEFQASNQWAHDINGKTWVQIINECNVTWRVLGENLSLGYSDAHSQFIAWRNSPSHNAVMLDSRYNHIGIYSADSSLYNYSVMHVSN